MRIAADPGVLSAGTYRARVLVTDAQGRSLAPAVPLTFEVTAGPAQFAIAPTFLRLSGLVSAASIPAAILVRNTGSGDLGPVSASVISPTPWLRVSTADCARECVARVTAAVTGLAAGSHLGAIRISSAAASRDVPVSLLLADRGPVLSATPEALYFEMKQGSTLAQTQTVSISNAGEGAFMWGVDLSGARWLALATTAEPVDPGRPGTLAVIANPAGLAEGVYSSVIAVSSAAGNVAIPVRLRITPPSAPLALDVMPAGLLFKAVAGSEAQMRTVNVVSNTSDTIGYQASAQVNETANTAWLSVTPSRGSIPDANRRAPSIAVNIAASAMNLRQGVSTGEVVFSPGSTDVRSLNVALVVTPAGNDVCNPQNIAIVHTGLANHFRLRAGTPVPLSVQLMNECGNAPDAAVLVTFSNGDTGVSLSHQGGGIWTGTWVPRTAAPSVMVTARAFTESLMPATAEVNGSIEPDTLPVLFPGGVIDNLNGVAGAAVAPGTIVQIFGSSFTAVPLQASFTSGRLPLTLGGVSVRIGGFDAPLYYVSAGQINAQVPVELQAGRRYSVVVTSRGIATNADSVVLAPAQPGIATFLDGRAIAQDSKFQLIGPERPARAGDYLVIYLTGLGATSPSVETGAQAPVDPLARVIRTPEVLLDGARVEVLFAGLTPGVRRPLSDQLSRAPQPSLRRSEARRRQGDGPQQ